MSTDNHPKSVNTRPSASVVIPAHNEAATLERLLGSLLADSAPGELAVFVVCNGCGDDTAERARAFADVTVIELDKASKVAALNRGDEAAGELFPRIYLDADIAVDTDAVRRVIEVLATDRPIAAAPEMRVVTTGRPLIVRGFYHVFTRTPLVTHNLIGSGFYGMSRAGRGRFVEFPGLVNDDLFVRLQFADDERVSVLGSYFNVEAPYSTRSLVRAKARVAFGTGELLEIQRAQRVAQGGHRRPPRGGNLPLLRMLKRPANWAPMAAYLYVRGAAQTIRYVRWWSGLGPSWGQDRTTRITS